MPVSSADTVFILWKISTNKYTTSSTKQRAYSALDATMDPSKIKPVPIQQTILLINNFIFNTTRFINDFTETCERKLYRVSGQITRLEVVLAILEAKLHSIPGLEFGSADNLPVPPSDAAPPPIEPAMPDIADAPVVDAVEQVVAAPADTIPACEHPDYAPFFKLLKVGVPLPVVMGKVSAAGLDASVLEDPTRQVPRPEDSNGID